ncbi:MAG: hypothetical protein RR461_01710 [Angelakisella sp.]
MRRGGRRGCGNGMMPLICIAFGAGIILSLFCSLKLVVILAAVFLVVLGVMCTGC